MRLTLRPLPLVLMLCTTGALAENGELVMLAPLDQAMPIARFHNGVISHGIVKDVGDALAQRLGRQAIYMSTDTQDVTPNLSSGRADAMCYVMPFWIDGDYNWTVPFLPDAEMIASRNDAPHVHSLKDLKDKPVGTVTDYRYPRVQQVLGERFKRVDAANMDQNIQQVLAGKVQYAMMSEATLQYQHRLHPNLRMRPELVFSSYKAQCAFSQNSRIPFEEVTRAVDSLIKDGSIDRILARYR